MGRGALFITAFVLLSAGAILVGGKQRALETVAEQGSHQYQVIARDVARSGFNRAVSTLKREREDVGSTFERVTLEDGYYDLALQRNHYGDYNVYVKAESGGALDSVYGNLIYTAPLPAAVMVEDVFMEGWGQSNFKISGVDQRMPSVGSGYEVGLHPPIHGLTTTNTLLDTLMSRMPDKGIVGKAGTGGLKAVDDGSFAENFRESYVDSLFAEAYSKRHYMIGETVDASLRQSRLQANVSTNPDDPRIIYVDGGIAIDQPLHGIGMLIVDDGDLLVSTDEFLWEGIVMVRKQDTDSVRVHLSNGAKIYGGLMMFDEDGTDEDTCVPDFNIDGNTTTPQEPFKVYMKVLGAAISYGGAYDLPVTVRIHIGDQVYEPFGSYDLPLDGNVNTGSQYSFEPPVSFGAGAGIRIDARSWVRTSGDGTDNSHWSIHMEKNSLTVDAQLEVLRDGSPTPNVGGFLDQASAAEFVADYIDDSDPLNLTMTMEENQSINLFELGMSDPTSIAHDMQDLVMISSMVRENCDPNPTESFTEFKIYNGAMIYYSSEAVAKLGKHLDFFAERTGVAVSKSLSLGFKAGERPDGADHFVASLEEDDFEEDEPEAAEAGEKIVICHRPYKNGGQTKNVKVEKLGKHMAHRDYVGPCDPNFNPGDDFDD